MNSPLISAIVSMYKAERFIRGCLEDLVGQTIFDQSEVIVIDACSPENEGAIVREFQRQYPNIIYLRTEKREGLYASWNRAARLARGKYLTNANADDRHHPEHFARLSSALEDNPDIALVYADFRMTREANSLFATAPIAERFNRLPYDHLALLHLCEVGPQPMWRARLHEELGWFDEDLAVVGDLDFWLRISEKYPLLHIPEELGLYLSHGDNLETADAQRTYDEDRLVKSKYTRRFLHKDFQWREPLGGLLDKYAKPLGHMLAHLETIQTRDDRRALDCNVFACALLTAKMGDSTAALDIMRMYFSLVEDGIHLLHLYAILLTTLPGQRAGARIIRNAPAASSPLLSVIMPVRNQGDRFADLQESLHGVRTQSIVNWEMIIVNDGSEDDTLPLLRKEVAELHDPRIRIVSQAKGGKAAALNLGLEHSRASCICVLAPGDILVPAYFQMALELLRQDAALSWVLPHRLLFGALNRPAFTGAGVLRDVLLDPLASVSSVYKKSLHERLGAYDDAMLDFAEWEFMVRCAEHGLRGETTSAPCLLKRCLFRLPVLPTRDVRRILERFMRGHGWWYTGEAADMLYSSLRSGGMPCLSQNVLHQAHLQAMNAFSREPEAMRGLVEKLRNEHQAGRAVTTQKKSGLAPLTNKDVPVFITSYNRLACLKLLLEWLEKSGFEKITILDNTSSYPPLLEFLRTTPHRVVRLEENLGHLALWKCGQFNELLDKEFFILSDPDIVPDEICPGDVTARFHELLMRFPAVAKVGFSLRIDDLPDHYIFKESVVAWEEYFWKNPLENGKIYHNELDTTFALYRPGISPAKDEARWYSAIRTGAPYIARHLPWYADSANPTEEELFYKASHERGVSYWNMEDVAELKLDNAKQKRKIADLHKELREKNNLINHMASENAKCKKRIAYLEKLAKSRLQSL